MSVFTKINGKGGLLLFAALALVVLDISQTAALEINGTNWPDPDVGLELLSLNFQPRTTLIKRKDIQANLVSGKSASSLPTSGFYLSTFKTTAYTASRYCRMTGRSLLSIENDLKQSILEQYIHERRIQDSLWTSGTDVHEEGRWVWGSGEDILFNNFLPDQVNSGDYNCISFNTAIPHRFKWYIDYCGDFKYFICEF